MRRHGFLAALLLGTAATTGWLLQRNTDLGASEESGRSFRQALAGTSVDESAVEDPNGVRLNFYDSTWERVLRSLAEQQNLTLVMDQIPPGRFARRDRRTYDVDAAIRILNAELEPQGFRLLRQNNFLIVLNLDRARTEYARPRLDNSSASRLVRRPDASAVDALPASLSSASADQVPNHFPATSINTGSRAPADHRGTSSAANGMTSAPNSSTAGSQDRFPVPQRETTSNSSERATRLLPEPRSAAAERAVASRRGLTTTQPVRPISFQSQDAEPPHAEPFPTDAEAASGSRAEVVEPMQIQTVSCQHTRAADLAKTLYLAFEKRAELQRDGLHGLPSFVVYPTATPNAVGTDRTAIFRMGINQDDNQLVIEAPATRLKHLVSLAMELDKPRQDIAPNEAVRLLPNNGIAAKTTKDLNDQIHQLVTMRDESAGGRQAGSQVNADPAPDGDAAQQSGESLNLRGPVTIEAIPDLDIMLMIGNEADVNKVAELIARLEQMSIGSVPDVHMHPLKNVNSEAMAELMTSVFDRLAELRQRGNTSRQSIAVIPVVQPNAILILAPEIEMDSIRKLANKLDKPLEPDFEFQVFPLRNAIASQVVTSLESFYSEPAGLRTRPRVVADVRTNSVIVQGRANDLSEVARLIERIDKDESGAVHRVQIFALKNAVAEELQTTINSAIQSVINPPQQGIGGGQQGFGGFGGTQGAQELRDSKSVALEFLASDGATRELVRSGILADVRVNSDIRTNSLIVSAPEASLHLMSALILELDRSPAAIAEIKVFTLKNADATQSVALLESTFESQNQQDQLGIQIAGTEDAVSSLIPARFSADIRTNSVLAVGSGEALSVVEAILLRLDTADVRQRVTEVIPLRNAAADLVSVSLTSFLEQQAALQDSSEDLLSNIERLRMEVLLAADITTNSLIVSASPQYFSQIAEIIQALDATPPEVVIQALIVEVTLDATDEFGIELGFQDPLLLSRSLTATTQPVPGMNFNNTLLGLGNGTTSRGTVGTQGLSNFSLGRQNADLGFGGFVFSAQSDSVSVLLRALASRRTVQVLSRPQIRTTHNNLAIVSVGQSVPVVSGVNLTQLGVANPNITRENTGITLEVTPRITPEGMIALSVYANKSSLAPNGVPIFVDGNSGNTIESPIINQSIADTVVNVPNGQTIVIGGMITKNDSTLERKVPWLGDLPYIGSAFRYDGTSTSRTELLIFLTPRIILNDLDSELIKQIEAERLHFIESDAEELHGPLYSVPPANDCFDDPYQGFDQQYFAPPLTPVMPGAPLLPDAPGMLNQSGVSNPSIEENVRQEPLPELDELQEAGVQQAGASGEKSSVRKAVRAGFLSSRLRRQKNTE